MQMADHRPPVLLPVLMLLAGALACNMPELSGPAPAQHSQDDTVPTGQPEPTTPPEETKIEIELTCGSLLDESPDGTLYEGETLACAVSGLPQGLNRSELVLEVTDPDYNDPYDLEIVIEWLESGADVYDKWFDSWFERQASGADFYDQWVGDLFTVSIPLPPGEATLLLVHPPSGDKLAAQTITVEPFTAPDAEPMLADLPRFEEPYPGWCVVIFDARQPPFDDVRVRRLFSAAIDRERAVEADCGCGHKERQPAPLMNPPQAYESLGGPEPHPYAAWMGWTSGVDMGEAASLLKDYEGTITLGVDRGGHETITEAIIANWKEHLGIEVELATYDWDEHLDVIHGPDAPSAYLLCGYLEIANPFDWLYAVVNDAYGDYILWEPPTEYNLILLEAFKTGDPALYAEAERMLVVRHAAVAPVYHYIFEP